MALYSGLKFPPLSRQSRSTLLRNNQGIVLWTNLLIRVSACLDLHKHSILRSERDQRLRLNPVTGEQPQFPFLRQCGQNQNTLHPGKGFSNALPRARAEREVSKLRTLDLTCRREPIRIEAQRIGEIPGIAVCDELADQNRGSRGKKIISQGEITA